jgi:hypothetical protein
MHFDVMNQHASAIKLGVINLYIAEFAEHE